MSKGRYRVPISLDRSTLDHEITLEGKGMRMRPLPVKVLMYWFLAFVMIAFILVKSPFSAAPVWMLFFLFVWMVAAVVVMGKRTKTNEFTFMQVPALIAYLPRPARKVMARRNSKPFGFMSIVGIKSISRTGIIYFVNGDVGQMYSVVGSASRLIFDSDRDAIMRRVDAFYRKVDDECSWIQITTKEPQRVFEQVAAVEQQNLALVYTDPDLRSLLEERLTVLTTQVADTFESLHQYLLVRGPRLKSLQNAHKSLVGERTHSSLFLRRCEILKGDATLKVLGSVYRVERNDETSAADLRAALD